MRNDTPVLFPEERNMNKTYALVWNQAQGCWSAVGETARRRAKPGSAKRV
ncbi:ESPR domain-containing protein, partial [Burkholderia contaminans]